VFFVSGHVYKSASREEMYGKISLSVVSVQTLWSLVDRDRGGLLKMIEICCGAGGVPGGLSRLGLIDVAFITS